MPRPVKHPISIGQKFERWTVLARAESGYYWHCRCDCGMEHVVFGGNLTRGLSTSCGCAAIGRPRTHGHACNGKLTRTYAAFRAMHRRCKLPSQKGFEYYGGRGIRVCKRWAKFENFLADMGECPPGLTLERKRVNGHYTPSNCEWIPSAAQARNKRSVHLIDGTPATIYATQRGYCLSTLYRRAKQRGTDFITELRKEIRHA